ncbi:DUF6351 family protein [Nocardioides sp. SOB77]|uniref:DUF6351 family protein n=1 Tax=Nocardioides oceani TaxID=3058369 RepID=A0ABT8FCJ9_9ACTN|nr:DUF6351 family protein [Nocardioides oceani]MDN4172319.1 DUF6351 family protein [Nocardioides oceani]
MRSRLLALACLCLVLPLMALLPRPAADAVPPAPQPRPLVVEVLSNRADLVSGGDVLVAVRLPRGVREREVRVLAGRRDVTRRFAVRRDGRYVGLVTGLSTGRTTLRVTAPGWRGSAVVTNHPAGGPVLSGPRSPHYACQETARNARCEEPVRYSYLYRSTDPLQAGLQPYDPADPPADVATTTTDRGVRVPFVVRREDGYQDRDRYTILTLFRPGRPWTAWAPQRQWNRKLLVTHGGGCGASYTPDEPPLDDYSGTIPAVPGVEPSYVAALGRGFAVMSTALADTGHNCSVAMNAESLMMAKERLVERYGELRYTIGTGCSGGSIAQHTVANAYPGIYQGLVTTCSYPDVLTAGAQFADYHLMRLYFEDPSRWSPGVVWSPTQMAQVEGHLSHLNAVVADEGLFKAALDPEHACPGTRAPVAGDPATRYDSETNPGGVRCSVLDLMVNLLGRRPREAWGPQERALGRGFAGIPFANSGVQYGLEALRAGAITPAQFVDLNAAIGGLDVDSVRTDARTTGDPASVRRAYRTGLVNEANHLDEVAMINHGGPDPGIAHDYSHAWWTEERLLADQGHTDNRVMWFGAVPLIGDLGWATEALLAMDRWLARVEQDRSARPLAAKVVAGRPADVTDRCLVTGLDPVCTARELDVLQTRLSTPRQEAGGPSANDTLACRLRPLRRADHTGLAGLPVPFTDTEWSRLERTFPDGVCDWSRPGLGQGPARTWLRYDARDGRGAAYGGRELPRPPAHSGGGWASPAFAALLRQ